MTQADPRVALLRGVNVGGRNRLPMADLRRILQDLALTRVETLIQSGNAVFCGGPPDRTLAPAITAAVEARFGFAPKVFLRRLADLEAALDHPFGGAAPAQLHAVFLDDPAALPDEAGLARLRKDEAWSLRPGLLILHTPSGLGTSRLAAALPRLLKCGHTARNLATVAALAEMLRARAATAG